MNTSTQSEKPPEGYMRDAKGSLVPERLVKPIDKERDVLVWNIVGEAEKLSKLIQDFKVKAMAQVEAFATLSAKEYGVKWGGKKGNITLHSYDAEYKIQIAVADRIYFDERLQVAKELIDRCITRWAKDSRDEIRALVNYAFQVDKQGKINTDRVLGLRKLDIKDGDWLKAMGAISDSIQVASSKSYIRLYRRQPDGSYEQINLDVAAL